MDTNEIYESLNDAGRKLGYLGALKVPEYAYEDGAEFVRRGHRIRVFY